MRSSLGRFFFLSRWILSLQSERCRRCRLCQQGERKRVVTVGRMGQKVFLLDLPQAILEPLYIQ